MTTCTIDRERFELVKDIPFSVGAASLGSDGKPCDACVMQIINFIFEQGWTDQSKIVCPTIGAFLRRYNDATDQGGRDHLKAWLFGENLDDFTNAYRVVATAGDGHTQARGYLMADTVVRDFLPAWLETAGATGVATDLRNSKQIVDAATARASRKLISVARAALPDYWERRRVLQERIKAEILERLKDKPAIAAIAASAASDAIAASAASAASAAIDAIAASAASDAIDASAAIDAIAASAASDAIDASAASAASDAIAAIAAIAASAAIDAIDAIDASDAIAASAAKRSVYLEVKKAIREKMTEILDAKRAEAGIKPVKESAIDLLGAMVSIGEAA